MKTFIASLVFCSSFFLTSCATQSVYLQNTVVDGPQVQPPLFITKENRKGDLRIAPRFSINDKTRLEGRATGHSQVDAQGVFQVDTVNNNGVLTFIERKDKNINTFQGRNFTWTPSDFTASLDFDYVAASHVSLVWGANYSTGSSKSFLGANAGAAFSFEDNYTAVRFDVGAHWSTVEYNVEYAIARTGFGSSETRVQFFRENGRASHWNAYGAFTFNTKAPSLPLQFFTQLAINRQTVVDLDRRSDFTNDKSVVLESVSYFLITPGVYFDVSPKSRLLIGLQLRDETALLVAEPGVLLAPFVQFEFGM
jgi:hypothetical protein